MLKKTTCTLLLAAALFAAPPLPVPAGRGAWLGPAPAAASDDYLVQTTFAVRQMEIQMRRFTSRASEVDTLTRCSFEKGRREYYRAREALLAKVERAKKSPEAASWLKTEIEADLKRLQKTYERAISCYR